MTLKDWKKVGTTDVAEWKHKKKVDLSVVVSSVGSGNYEVELKKYAYDTGVYRDVLKSFNSKSSALAFAKSYMRSH